MKKRGKKLRIEKLKETNKEKFSESERKKV